MQLQGILPFLVGLLTSSGSAFILVLIEGLLITQPTSSRDQRRFFYWGTTASLVMLAGLLTTVWAHDAPGSGGAQLAALFALIALSPILVGCLVFLLINWQEIHQMGARSLLFLLPLAGLSILMALFNPGITLALLAITVLLTLLWQIPWWAVDLLSAVVLLVLLFQKLFWPDIPVLGVDISSNLPALLAGIVSVGVSILMLLAYLLPASLLYNSLKIKTHQNWTRQSIRWGLAAVLLLFLAYDIGENAFWASAQSRLIEDNFPFQTILPILFGALLALFLPGWRRLAGALYGVLAPALLAAAFVVGWSISNTSVTAGRAGRIENALASYYQQNGRYPELLEQLTPGYLLFNLPAAGNNLERSWCYESGPQAYRLGYVAVKFRVPYRMPDVSVAIIQQVGSLSNASWDCDSKAQAVKAIYAARFH
jgi:MFS family permease